MRLRAFLVGLALLFASLGWAETLVVYPLTSQDVLLGVAVADRVAQAFDGSFETVGPDVAPALVPPITTADGFINLTDFFSEDALASTRGARLLQDLLGADNVVTGRLTFAESVVTAHVFYVHDHVARSFSLSAPDDDPSLLVEKVVAVLAARLDVDEGVDQPAADSGIDLSGPYGDYVRAVALVGAGFVEDARAVLEEAAASTDSGATTPTEADTETEARSAELLQDIDAARVGEALAGAEARAARLATLSLGVAPLDEAISLRYFQAFADQTALPVAQTWLATLYASDKQEGQAAAAFDMAASSSDYEFGRAARAAFQASRGLAAEDLPGLLESDSLASLLTVSLVAQDTADTAQEKAALTQLTRAAPDFVYPFERLSFIAFDEDDPLAAAQALAVATRLAPENDLYWTNLGWSYYLLGLFDQSEVASTRALTLAPQQTIALYNLGLARAVTGRLAEAMDAYDEALTLDPEVDAAAVDDLENALRLYPQQTGLNYPLATLYEQQERRDDAARALERYLGGNPSDALAEAARTRLEVLRAPLPPLEISESPTVGLGPTGLDAAPFHPGDRVFPSFELYTSGAELPRRVTVNVALKDGDTVLAEQSRDLDIPTNAIGFVVDSLGVDLPTDAAGTYTLQLSATASEDRSITAEVPLEVVGQPGLLRGLLSQNITMLALESQTALYARSDLNEGDDALITTLLGELQGSADAADATLPAIASGRFQGFSGGQLFSDSSAADVRDFLSYLLAQNSADATFSFVDAYAQWALSGAPTE